MFIILKYKSEPPKAKPYMSPGVERAVFKSQNIPVELRDAQVLVKWVFKNYGIGRYMCCFMCGGRAARAGDGLKGIMIYPDGSFRNMHVKNSEQKQQE